MDFEEYLIALGKKDRSDRIRAAFLAQTEMPGFIHDELIKDYMDYLLYGGMPAVVQQYISDRDHQQVSSVAKKGGFYLHAFRQHQLSFQDGQKQWPDSVAI